MHIAKKGKLKRETKSILMAQSNFIRAHYIKAKILNRIASVGYVETEMKQFSR